MRVFTVCVLLHLMVGCVGLSMDFAKLSRVDLQVLAKQNNIKANLKSSEIIAQLEKLPGLSASTLAPVTPAPRASAPAPAPATSTSTSAAASKKKVVEKTTEDKRVNKALEEQGLQMEDLFELRRTLASEAYKVDQPSEEQQAKKSFMNKLKSKAKKEERLASKTAASPQAPAAARVAAPIAAVTTPSPAQLAAAAAAEAGRVKEAEEALKRKMQAQEEEIRHNKEKIQKNEQERKARYEAIKKADADESARKAAVRSAEKTKLAAATAAVAAKKTSAAPPAPAPAPAPVPVPVPVIKAVPWVPVPGASKADLDAKEKKNEAQYAEKMRANRAAAMKKITSRQVAVPAPPPPAPAPAPAPAPVPVPAPAPVPVPVIKAVPWVPVPGASKADLDAKEKKNEAQYAEKMRANRAAAMKKITSRQVAVPAPPAPAPVAIVAEAASPAETPKEPEEKKRCCYSAEVEMKERAAAQAYKEKMAKIRSGGSPVMAGALKVVSTKPPVAPATPSVAPTTTAPAKSSPTPSLADAELANAASGLTNALASVAKATLQALVSPFGWSPNSIITKPEYKEAKQGVANKSLDGVTLEKMLESLVDELGWQVLFEKTNIKSFSNKPTISSSLKNLRQPENKWMRDKVENLYRSYLVYNTLKNKNGL